MSESGSLISGSLTTVKGLKNEVDEIGGVDESQSCPPITGSGPKSGMSLGVRCPDVDGGGSPDVFRSEIILRRNIVTVPANL